MAEILQGTAASDAKQLADERFIRKIASLYYEEGYSQESIAETVYCSRQTVGKALQKARERGIVNITVVPDARAGYLRNLSREARIRLGLDDLVLVTGSNKSTTAGRGEIDNVIAEITRAAGEYLDNMLTGKEILGVSGGSEFIRGTVRYLRPGKLLDHLQVVATIGFAEPHTSFGDANLIAYDMAQIYGANHVWFPCPAFVSTREDVERLRNMPIIREGFDVMNQVNLVMTTVWPAKTNDILLGQKFCTMDDWHKIEEYEPASDINHWLFDVEGRCINELMKDFPYYLTGLDMSSLKTRIQRGDTRVIVVAGGDPIYSLAIHSILKAGLVNILVTDHLTAQTLMDMEEE